MTLPEDTILENRYRIDRLLAHVTAQQDRAVQRAGDSEPFQVFSFWMPEEEQPKPVRLKAYYPKKKGGTSGDGRHRIALLLEMDRVGAVRVDFSMAGGHLYIDFYVINTPLKERIARESDAVAQALQDRFDQIHISVHVSRQKIERFDREDLAATITGTIDLQA